MKIDKLFGEHLAKKGFEYTDSMWSEMDTLIEEGRKKSSKKRMPLYFISVILITAIVLIILLPGSRLDQSAKTQHNQFALKKSPKAVKSEVVNGAILHSDLTVKENLGTVVFEENVAHPSQQKNVDLNQKTRQISENIPSEQENKIVIPASEVRNDNRMDAIAVHEINVESLPEKCVVLEENIPAESSNAEIIDRQDVPQNVLKPDTVAQNKAEEKIKLPNEKDKWITYVDAVMAIPNSFEHISPRVSSNYTITENAKTASLAGLNLTFGKGFYSIGTGLLWQQFSGMNSFVKSQIDWTYSTGYRMVNPNYKISNTGNSIALIQKVKDSVGNTKTINLFSKTPFHFQYLNIPLNVGVQHYFGKLLCRAEAGISASLLLDKGGNYAVTNNQDAWVMTDLKNTDKVKLLLMNQQFSFTMGYTLNKTLMIFGKGMVQKAQSSMFNGFNERMNIKMIQFGFGGRF